MVEIVSTDYNAAPADGPMVAEAKVLQNLKGPLRSEGDSDSRRRPGLAPVIKPASYETLFLEKAASRGVSKPAEWRILGRLDAKTDFFIEKDSVQELSLKSPGSFLKQIHEPKKRPKRVVFDKRLLR